jgi:hypothetical protein
MKALFFWCDQIWVRTATDRIKGFPFLELSCIFALKFCLLKIEIVRKGVLDFVLKFLNTEVILMIFWSPCLQDAAKNNSQTAFKKFSESAWNSAMKCSLQGQLEVTGAVGRIDVSEVEPAKDIVKRFCTGND